MSHTTPGAPLFSDLKCLEKAAKLKGFEIVHTNKYNWYGRHMGDYPLPPGVKASEIGSNALFVLRMTAEKRAEHNCRDPYDIGVIADPNNEGCYTLIYDFYSGGHGVDKLLGAPITEKGSVKLLCPELKQAYDMVCDIEAAKEAGDEIDIMTKKEAGVKYPEIFEQSQDEKTWVSIVHTQNRIGIY